MWYCRAMLRCGGRVVAVQLHRRGLADTIGVATKKPYLSPQLPNQHGDDVDLMDEKKNRGRLVLNYKIEMHSRTAEPACSYDSVRSYG